MTFDNIRNIKILNDTKQYCPILYRIAKYCPILPNIEKYCPVLLHIVQVTISVHLYPTCDTVRQWTFIYCLISSNIALCGQALTNIV